MAILKRLYKPEYFHQPGRIWRPFAYKWCPPRDEVCPIQLAWGRSILANPRQAIGRSLYTFGLYDLPLTEMIFRLVRPGDVVVDVGANIGYTARLMLDRLGGCGTVHAFEPLPELFEVLSANFSDGGAHARLHNMAVSDHVGQATLTLPPHFAANDGIGTLEARSEGRKVKIRTTTLAALDLPGTVRLLKLDVEGHELAVLHGAGADLGTGKYENIVFEDLSGHRGPVARFLENHGYRIYKLVKGFTGLRVMDPDYAQVYSYDPDNFLATRDPAMAEEMNRRPEWQVFRWQIGRH